MFYNSKEKTRDYNIRIFYIIVKTQIFLKKLASFIILIKVIIYFEIKKQKRIYLTSKYLLD